MGAWGVGLFENDSALDLVVAATDSDGMTTITEAISEVAHAATTVVVDAPVVEAALAAAELVALAGGAAARELPPEADQWLQVHGEKVDGALMEGARAAVTRVLDGPSELRSLWFGSQPEGEDWLSGVRDLGNR